MFENADLIHSYSRADALRDGVLIEVTETAREAGSRFPVALTLAVWERYVAVPTREQLRVPVLLAAVPRPFGRRLW
jgi:hypothetical protein